MQGLLHLGGRGFCLAPVLLALCVFSHAEVHAQVQGKDQQLCINELNKNFAKVAKAQGKDICACIKDGAKGKLGALTVEACTTADRKGKVGKAQQKTRDKAGPGGKCPPSPSPDFGATDPDTVNGVGVSLELDLIHDIFGADLDVVIKASNSKEVSKCQQAVAKQAQKCADTMLKEYNKCKKDALRAAGDPVQSAEELQSACLGAGSALGGIPDPKGKIQKACVTKLDSTITKKCAGVDLEQAFPGLFAAARAAATNDELREAVESDVTAAIREADLLDECGNGVVESEPGEQCDDGNTDDEEDGCSSTCQVDLGWECTNEPDEPSVCTLLLVCGNGVTQGTEECDDGNTDACDGCSATCQLEGPCGDSIVDPVCEECDDGNQIDCDGCSAECKAEFCGDGKLCAGGGDADGDGILDDVDNCPYAANPNQEDEGGLNTSAPDGIGNACQCGDVNGTGDVTDTDGTIIERCVQGLSPCEGGGPELLPVPGNCDVNGTGDCTDTDATIVKRNVLGLSPFDPADPNLTLVEGQHCENAQPGDGAAGIVGGEECDDGNQVDGDGCSSECKIEECGNGVVDPGTEEDCDPPGSFCGDGGVCRDGCTCGFLGTTTTMTHVDQFCVGLKPDGSPYPDPDDPNAVPCLDAGTHSDCPPKAPTARCLAVSGALINTAIGTPTITFPLDGRFELRCGPIDPNSGQAVCSCEVENLQPQDLPGVGFICFNFVPKEDCVDGIIDCDGGSGRDATTITDHDAGPEVMELDPGQFILPFCGLLDPNDANPECDRMCDTRCENLEPAGSFRTILAACEGYCQSGPREDLPCDGDADCPFGSCGGGEGVPHRNFCGCDCLQVGGDPSPPGGLNCDLGVQINVEQAPPCGVGIITIFLLPKCVPISTELASGIILDSNANTGQTVGGRTLQGVRKSCSDVANGNVTGLNLNGAAHFMDSNIGDLQVEVLVTLK